MKPRIDRSKVSLVFVVLACLGLGLAAVGVAESRRPKNVEVALRVKWSGTPLLLEAGELLSKESNDVFWKFVEGWLYDGENNYDSYTARECLKKISSLGRSLLGVSLGPLYEFSLLLRSASPRLVVYRQLAEESLSSFPLVEDTSLRSNGNGSPGEIENSNSKKHESLLIGTNPTSPSGKCCWVDTGGALFFDTAELISWLDTSPEIGGEEFLQPGVFEFDHVYPDSNITSPVAVLYGALGTICFMELHGTLAEAAKKGRVTYVLRSVLPSGCEAKVGHCGAVGTGEFSKLGGYGVELALKNMEYKAMDDSAVKKGLTLEDPRTEDLSQDVRGFIFSKILERRPELASEINAFRDYMLSSTISDSLDVWELKDLGHQTAQRIVQASDPLQSMLDINQNFPSVVSSLSRMKLNESVKEEILANQRMIPPGKSLMALNGALINVEDVDLFQLIDLVHQDLSLADQFARMKIPQSTIRKLLRSMPPSESSAFRIDFRSSHVHYLNNLEEDARYRRWRSNINEILMPVFPGQLRYIRKNLYHAVYVIDPGSICGLEEIDMIMSLYENDLPMRFGVILYSLDFIERIEKSTYKDSRNNDDLSLLIIRLFLYVEENHGTQSAFQFLSNVNRLRIESADSDEALEVHHVEGAFVDTVLPKTKTPPQDILLKLERDQSFQLTAQESSIFVYKLGFGNSGCHLLMNGLVLEANEEALLNAMNEELPRIQEQVYYGHVNSHTNVLDKFLTENGVSRYNPQIIAASKTQMRFISLSASAEGGDSVLHEINYLHSSETVDDLKPVTHLLAVDIMSEKGMKLLHEGLNYLIQGSKLGRLGVLFTAFQDTDVSSLIFAEVFERAVSSYSHKEGILKFLDQLCLFHEHKDAFGSVASDESIQQIMDKVYELADENFIPAKALKSIFSGSFMDNMREKLGNATQFLHRMMGSRSTDNVVITNGRVLFPPANGSFTGDDLRLLESVEFNQRIKHVMEVIEAADWQNIDPDILTSKFFSDVIMVSSSAMAKRERSTEGARFEVLNAQYSSVSLGDENSSLHVDVVIDPLSSSGQKLASLLQILWKHVKPTMRIILNPLSSLVDLPLKNYYRFVAPTLDDYSIIDHSIHGPRAFFVNMPLSKTLTMNLDVPEPWLIEPVIAVHDLDNILLENLGETRTLQAVFELESLVLTGHCSEKDHDPPRGLQLILGTKSQPHLVDTLVMANLGYWQMKVSPGVWYLQLAPGRSSELYHLMENDGASQNEPSSKRITINDLRGKVVYLEVLKKKGKEHESLLSSTDDDDQSREKRGNQNSWNSNILRWASGLLGGSEQSKKQSSLPGKGERHGRTINIFSVASGHLYERFLKIMILSVLKNTQRPVKFWFIKNYLSPQFKDVIPHMAREYGFEYELITYKWPSWLHKQKEKQRIIWAYKILFLDVIFPLSLEKVIFVDADQIVRADMGELYDMDLKGRPLAYTPFCDNNKEMDGYRFWRQGFWKEHLRGRPYHISALYVVDLVTFRQTAAGDNLRVFYESLSKDPNSLSNLDQDLPNYAQHTVPIFSLPQEWLWCESWCGTATKSKAKTIDLCNNPMTKEPKLQGARRIVPEWTDLDSEARHFTTKILGDEPSPIEPHVTSADPEQASEGAATSYDIEEKSPDKSFEDLESKSETPHVTAADPEQASEGAATSSDIEEKSPDKSFEDLESKSEL